MSEVGAVPQAAELLVRPDRDLVSVVGADAARFLQGQLSQDVAGLPVGGSAWSLLLQPQGKVDAWFRVERSAADAFVLDVDAGFADPVVERLRRYLIRTDAQIDVTDRGVRRGDASEADRIAAGVPAMGAELVASTIPAEIGQWLIDVSVSFTKGCYTGQELVARLDSRGSNTPRNLRVLRLDGSGVQAGDAVVDAAGSDVAVVTSAADAVALAFLPRTVELPAVLTVRSAAGDRSASVTA